jgi:hypothetical protein
LKFHKIQ